MPINILKKIHTYIRTYTHIHTCIHTYINTHTHTHVHMQCGFLKIFQDRRNQTGKKISRPEDDLLINRNTSVFKVFITVQIIEFDGNKVNWSKYERFENGMQLKARTMSVDKPLPFRQCSIQFIHYYWLCNNLSTLERRLILTLPHKTHA